MHRASVARIQMHRRRVLTLRSSREWLTVQDMFGRGLNEYRVQTLTQGLTLQH